MQTRWIRAKRWIALVGLIGAAIVIRPGASAEKPKAAARPDDKPARVVFMIGEDEYKTNETLPEFAKTVLEPAGARCTIVLSDDKADKNSFPGIEAALKDADLLFVSVRRRTPPTAQLDAIRKYIDSGKPVIGMRTATHAFALREGKPVEGHSEWKTFDVDVLGCHYENHYQNKEGTDITNVPHTERNPILAGVENASFHSAGTLYRSRDVTAKGIILKGFAHEKGQVVEEPVAWTTSTNSRGRVFYTSLGYPDDFKIPTFRTILTNAVFWALNRPGPNEAAYQKALQQTGSDRNKLRDEEAANRDVLEFMKNFKGDGEVGDDSKPTPALQALKQFQVADGFQMELVASEPQVQQPLNINWDSRGRMWVVQYLQYPFPAGLKVVKYDQYLRAGFDKVPEPPPYGVKGADKITVLEDTDGDGTFDKVKDVITDLNIASSVLPGRGGLWVLNPPYLLFYPDRNGDDVPDTDPTVEISGFGLEDTHSVANSLKWGPDGWIYGANGSTTTANITTAATKNLQFKGQCIWRFHPETKVFEIFGEGGGNTFSFEFDAKGRAFSGTNNADTRGMHYVQGMYGKKNFGKHGPLTNPYAFGYFDHMKHEGFMERFPQTFMIYEAGVWPKKFDHQIISGNALHNRVQASELIRDTSSWRTKDTDLMVLTPDRWFRPVDCKAGPDGNVYFADWYDSRLTHVDPRDNWHKTSGRIYRLKSTDSKPVHVADLAKLDTAGLIEQLRNPNKWFRQQAQLVIGDRRDAAMLPALAPLLSQGTDQIALEALWAIYKIAGLDDATSMTGLNHVDPHVRRWTVRLIGDGRKATAAQAQKLIAMTRTEPDVEVRSQLASTAKRLPADVCLPMVKNLATRGEDISDMHLPLLIWWALESKADSDRSAVLALLSDKSWWAQPIAEKFLISRVMQRYALAGSQDDLVTCSKLLELSPDPTQTKKLLAGLEDAFKGRTLTNLPAALTNALSQYQESVGNRDVALGLRLNKPAAVDAALKVVSDEKANRSERMRYIEILGQVRQSRCVSPLLSVLKSTKSQSIKRVALIALTNFDDPQIGTRVVSLYHSALTDEDGVRATAYDMLTTRPAWTLSLLNEVDESRIKPQAIPMHVVQKMQLQSDPKIQSLISKHWGKVRSTPAEKQQEIDRYAKLLKTGVGDPAAGKPVFTAACAVCHTLFNEGGKIGPELTGYERTNLDFMLLAIVDPSAGIREEFTNFELTTTDGRTLTGFLGDQNERTVAIKGLDGQTQVLPREQVKTIHATPISIMPEGLLTALTEPQVRDLFAYLMSSPPARK